MKIYNPRGGALDNYLDQLIGKRYRVEIEREKIVRGGTSPIILDTISFFHNSFEVNGKGLFYYKDGQWYRTFLYLKRYNVVKWDRLPSKHLFKCITVQSYPNFSIANQDKVDVRCKDTGQLYENVELSVCGNCIDMFRQKTGKVLYGKDFNEIILDFEESEETRNTDTGTGGYVTNWNEISTAYRETKKYTCEKCGYKMTDRNGYKFMHVHHKKRKIDNQRENLQCLCIECHSEVDDTHRRNFSTFYQQRLIREFKEYYR